MCWRDDVPMRRKCVACGATYYGDLGHRNCPKDDIGYSRDEPEETEPEP